MKKTLYPMAMAFALLATSCNSYEDIFTDDADKDMISFSLSDGSRDSRAGFLGSETTIAMRMQSDEKGGSGVRYTRTVATASVDATNSTTSYSNVTFSNAYKRYWDDAFGRKGQISVYAIAVPNGGTSLTNNGSTLENLLTVGDATNTWGSNATNTIAWQVTTSAQTKDATTAISPTSTIDLEDLVYANNIQADATLGKDGRYTYDFTAKKYTPDPTGAEGAHSDGRLIFTQAESAVESDPGHFDKGHLKFKHALSRMTIQIISGDGAGAFNFATGTNIKLLGMNVSGTFDVKTGVWTTKTTGNINKLAKTTAETTAVGTYTAQMLPDYVFTNGAATNVMEFTIDNNTYYITQDMLFDALTYDKDGDGVYDSADGDGQLVDKKNEASITMEQGKNYVFKITVNKTKIENITATLADWVYVTAADESINNSHVKFTLGSYDGTTCSDFQFYRLKEDLGNIITTDGYSATTFGGDYKTEGAATLTGPDASGKYSTNWFFDDNRTAYHFRTLNQLAADENGTSSDDKSENIANTTGTPAKSYFTMRAGAQTQDYHWGAPMQAGKNLAYNTSNGFSDNIYKGLTSTESDIKVTELHMMSNLNIVLKTSTGSDAVKLDGATVTLTKLSKDATVDMGTGLITPNTTNVASNTQVLTAPSSSDYWTTTNVQTKPFTCAVIPQNLTRGSADDDYVGITITTSDNNQYYVVKRLSEILATSVTADERNQQKDQPITYWYPNHTYTYTFTITKNAIDNITATVAKWVDVTAGNKDLTLED